MKGKVAMIGVYPPPLGGISIHIQRLCKYLDQIEVPYTVYDNVPGKKEKEIVFTGPIEKWSVKYFFTAKESVIHCHFLRWQVRFFLSLLKLRGKRIIFTFHSYRPNEEHLSFIKRWMIRITGFLGDAFICVSEKIAEDLVAVGIPRKKIEVISGFIPPVGDLHPPIPASVERFISEGSPIIVANGVVGNFYNNEDLYGVDLCIELTRALREDYPNLRFVFCITQTINEAYRKQLEEKIHSYGLEDHFLFTHGMEFYPLIMRADLLVRPTNSDGDAISIREALWFGTPVLASDCVQRPKEVKLFKNRDIVDLVEKTKEVLNEPKPHPIRTENLAEKIVALYKLEGRSDS
jgi:glycosyltransferase involved in cell wall biosynthesis